jgi:hypothetical protein
LQTGQKQSITNREGWDKTQNHAKVLFNSKARQIQWVNVGLLLGFSSKIPVNLFDPV